VTALRTRTEAAPAASVPSSPQPKRLRLSSWDAKYTPLLSSHDQGQPAQRGGWLTASVGKGRWTYMAYALHRQVPYGVAGAYRILANLISN